MRKTFLNQKIGYHLIKNVLDFLFFEQQVSMVNLHVNFNNIPAQKLYSKFGFKCTGWEFRFYGEEGDGLSMAITYTDYKNKFFS